VKASEVISNGGVIAFRTDTFYGLGADPFNRAAVIRIRELKGRDDTKPILLLVSDTQEIERLISERSLHFETAAKLWPGPLTIVGKAVASLPEEITAGTGTVGVRLPAATSVCDFVRKCGGVLTATSANPSGSEPARSAAEVARYFPRGLDSIIDGGEVSATEPSTVLDVSCSPPRIVREGAISQAVIDQLFAEYD